MTEKLRFLPAGKIIKVLRKIGFEVSRQRESHVILENKKGTTIIVVPSVRERILSGGLPIKIKILDLPTREVVFSGIQN